MEKKDTEKEDNLPPKRSRSLNDLAIKKGHNSTLSQRIPPKTPIPQQPPKLLNNETKTKTQDTNLEDSYREGSSKYFKQPIDLDYAYEQLNQEVNLNQTTRKRKKNSMDEELISFVVAKNNLLFKPEFEFDAQPTIAPKSRITDNYNNNNNNLIFDNNKNITNNKNHSNLFTLFRKSRFRRRKQPIMPTYKLDDRTIRQHKYQKRMDHIHCGEFELSRSSNTRTKSSITRERSKNNLKPKEETDNFQINTPRIKLVSGKNNSTKSSTSSNSTSLSNGTSIKKDIRKQKHDYLATRDKILESVGVSDVIEDISSNESTFENTTTEIPRNIQKVQTLPEKEKPVENRIDDIRLENAKVQALSKKLLDKRNALELYSGKGLYELIFKHEKTYHHHNKQVNSVTSSRTSLRETNRKNDQDQDQEIAEVPRLKLLDEQVINDRSHQKEIQIQKSLNNFMTAGSDSSTNSSTEVLNSFKELLDLSLV
ncbi:unnamed protein product [Candida verbasci]|uniref:Uncharacterized protein n=1 Tax=Candida verbasci TaxID=1227364 RepID=A0A9W4TSQ9_9ASCO|nr:unnamed protein product [Candida verbasci]